MGVTSVAVLFSLGTVAQIVKFMWSLLTDLDHEHTAGPLLVDGP